MGPDLTQTFSAAHRRFTSPDDWLSTIEPHFSGGRYSRRRQPFSVWARLEKLAGAVLLDSYTAKSGLDAREDIDGFSIEAIESSPCFILWQQAGKARIKQSNRAMELRAGEWAIFDACIPTAFLVQDSSRTIGLTLPRRSREWSRRVDPGGSRLNCSVASRVASAMLLEALGCGEWVAPQLQSSMDAVLADAVEASLPTAACEHEHLASARVTLDRARRAIEAQLANPDLTPDHIGRAIGQSRRSLYRIFRQVGQTPMGLVHELRLTEAARLLRDRSAAERSVTAVAYAVGFVDSTHFSRLFRARYGVSPKQWTASALSS